MLQSLQREAWEVTHTGRQYVRNDEEGVQEEKPEEFREGCIKGNVCRVPETQRFLD